MRRWAVLTRLENMGRAVIKAQSVQVAAKRKVERLKE